MNRQLLRQLYADRAQKETLLIHLAAIPLHQRRLATRLPLLHQPSASLSLALAPMDGET
jgi:hypothetical protein